MKTFICSVLAAIVILCSPNNIWAHESPNSHKPLSAVVDVADSELISVVGGASREQEKLCNIIAGVSVAAMFFPPSQGIAIALMIADMALCL